MKKDEAAAGIILQEHEMQDFQVSKAIATVYEFDGVPPLVIVKRTGGTSIQNARNLVQALTQAIAAAELLTVQQDGPK